jgi:hypothetical protein
VPEAAATRGVVDPRVGAVELRQHRDEHQCCDEDDADVN